MSLNITQGIQRKAPRIVLYGLSGVGKTTLAASIPGALVLDLEGGSAGVDCARADLSSASWSDLESAIDELTSDRGGFQTVVIDTATVAQKMAEEQVCKEGRKKSIADFGFGKGDVATLAKMQGLLAKLDALRDSGMAIVLTAQADITPFNRPEDLGSYDRWRIRLSKKVGPEVLAWADAVGFMSYKTTVVQDENGRGHAVNEQRILNFERTGAFDAKNRYGLGNSLPATLDALAPIFSA